jgi:hypothetical protein
VLSITCKRRLIVSMWVNRSKRTASVWPITIYRHPPCGFDQHLGTNFHGPQSCGCIGGKIGLPVPRQRLPPAFSRWRIARRRIWFAQLHLHRRLNPNVHPHRSMASIKPGHSSPSPATHVVSRGTVHAALIRSDRARDSQHR